MTVEAGVLERYSEGADSLQPDLCCPVNYDRELLEILLNEIIEKDYGCGDPSRYVKNGDVELDLGSGSGKICYMAAQLVCKSSYNLLTSETYSDDFLGITPALEREEKVWCCTPGTLPSVAETKGSLHKVNSNPDSCCG